MATKVKEKQEDSYYTSFVNTMYELPWKKIGVCLLVAGVLLAPFVAAAMAPLARQVNDQSNGANSLADRVIEPCTAEDCPTMVSLVAQEHFAPACQTFPHWYHDQVVFDAAALTHVDLQHGNQIVSTAEVITDEFVDISSRQSATFTLLHQITQMHESQMSEVVTGIFNSAASRGFVLTLDARAFILGIDPKFVANHHKALKFVEKNLLCQENLTAEELEAHIVSLHRIFAEGTHVSGGTYREGLVLLQGDNVGSELEDVVEIVRQREPLAVKEFERIYRELFRASNREQALKSLTEEEKRVFGLAFDIDFPFPDEVPQKMKQFCRDYIAKLRANVPVIEFVSWIHDTLIGIHPWEDWNGHMSRALVNGELAREGHLPFLIFDDAKYNDAVRKHQFKAHLIGAQKKVQKLAERFKREEPMKKVLVKV